MQIKEWLPCVPQLWSHSQINDDYWYSIHLCEIGHNLCPYQDCFLHVRNHRVYHFSWTSGISKSLQVYSPWTFRSCSPWWVQISISDLLLCEFPTWVFMNWKLSWVLQIELNPTNWAESYKLSWIDRPSVPQVGPLLLFFNNIPSCMLQCKVSFHKGTANAVTAPWKSPLLGGRGERTYQIKITECKKHWLRDFSVIDNLLYL